MRIFQIAKELNISHKGIILFLDTKGIKVGLMDSIDQQIHQLILNEFSKEKEIVDRYRKEKVRKEIHDTRVRQKQQEKSNLKLLTLKEQRSLEEQELIKQKAREEEKQKQDAENKKKEKLKAEEEKKKKDEKNEESTITKGKKRKMRKIEIADIESEIGLTGRKRPPKHTSDTKKKDAPKNVQEMVKKTLAKMETKSRKKVYKKEKDKDEEQSADGTLNEIKIPEFSSVDELSKIFQSSPSDVIQKCIGMGVLATMNQRLEWDVIELLAEDYGFTAEKITDGGEEIFSLKESEEDIAKAQSRAPVVTIMGHVDHGKTSILDYIRKTNIVAGESGGITQHIGAYKVELEDGKYITFLDTPGHEAFTAMRARGAQVTDIVILVVAADDSVKPQTIEAIDHARAANVPLIVAINKIDKPGTDVEKVKRELSDHDVLVEDWGGKIQSHDISAKTGDGVNELLEKVLLEAELLELKANPDRSASGTVVEAFLDKGRGYVSTVLVQTGTLKIGDFVLAGKNTGKVKAMFDERGNTLEIAGPSTPVSILGLDGAAQAGDNFSVHNDEREAKQIATKRNQLQREQSVRTQKHITLDEIGRRIALGEFKELNIILKGDVDGSVEALTDSFEKLSTEEIQVNIIHKGVGAITESDVLLASASDALVIGFNVRPMGNAREVAEKEEIDIRTYSIIYDAINELKDAMEGLLSPDIKEEITGLCEVRDVFKISKLGTIAGCMVTKGSILRNSDVRLIREGVVIFSGSLQSLKRFKDDVKEVKKGYDCGLQINEFKDIKVGDEIEGFINVEIKKKL